MSKMKKDLNLKAHLRVYESLQFEAITAILTNDIEYFERKVRRWYSKTFHTPLHEVYGLPWDFILKNYYESVLETQGHNTAYDMAIEYIPELKEEQDQRDAEFDKFLEEKQAKQLAKKQSKSPKKSQSLKNSPGKPITNLKKDFDMDSPEE